MELAHLLVFLSCIAVSQASFLYGQPCSIRNTAYLYSIKWTFPPNNAEVNCVDITGYKTPNMTDFSDFFRKVSKADTLYADHMNLTRFPVVIIHNLPFLKLVDLSGNSIRRLPHKLYKLAPKVEKLLLADNSVMIPRKKPLLFSGSLRTLMLSDNKIKTLYKVTFTKLPALEVLYLDRNHLKRISPEMFKVTPKLKYLHVGQNQIVKIPPKDVMPGSLMHYIVKDQRVN